MKCLIVDIGLMPYGECLQLQEKIIEAKQKGILAEDVFLLVEHPPVFTCGKDFSEDSLKVSREKIKGEGIEMFQINRGGNVTYHGPGQIVGYPILKMGLADSFVYPAKLEELMLRSVQQYAEGVFVRNDLNPESNKRFVGLWWKNGEIIYKLGSVGVQFRQFRGELFSMHGFAVNVCTTNLEHFDFIDPCGLKGVKVNSLQKICGQEIGIGAFKEYLKKEFCEMFGFEQTKDIDKKELITLLHTSSQPNHPIVR